MKLGSFIKSELGYLFVLVFLLAGGTITARAGDIDIGLREILESKSADQIVSVIVFMSDQVDLDAISRDMTSQNVTLRKRHEVVVTSLQNIASTTQGIIIASLSDLKRDGKIIEYEAFWISNAIRIDAPKSVIEELAERNDVARVYFNYETELIEPVEIKESEPGTITSVEIGLTAIRAPEVWALGIDGSGVLVANMDTGVEGDHPALADRWAGVADPRYAGHPEWAWYDPYLGQNDFPYDDGGHGTHTMGSVCGASPTTGDTVGVAPGALWIASAPIDRGGGIPGTVADAILSFQWMVDPDGNPFTNWDVPAVCSNSWGVTTSHGYPPCDTLFWSYLDACEAAGTVILFSAGNEGSSGLRRPGDRATDDYRTCAVAAVDAYTAGWPLASFSSTGPTYCTPDQTAAIKPDIAAPGVNIRSAYPGGGYTSMSGTSMASPHVNGVVALMRQANPNISVEMIKQIIYDTAYDLGPAGEDNSYGWGMIDAYEAVIMAMTDFGYVDGYVTDATTSDPLAATVEVVGSMISVQANSQGYYLLGAPADTTYTLRASLFGYFSQEQSIFVEIDDTVSLNFELTPWPPADLAYNPTLFNVATQPGNIESRDLTITNNGGGPLYYTLWTEIDDVLSRINISESKNLEPIGYRITDIGKAAKVNEPYYPPVITGQGGPDNYGHSWIDSDEPGGPAFNWIDISSIGTPIDFGLDIDDGNSGPLPLGFDFLFYGNNVNAINVCTNGWASFTNSTSVEFGNPMIPDPEAPNDLLAVFFDDMNLENGGTGYFYTNNTDSAIITWDHVPDWRQEGIFTFQIILRAPAKIKFQYLEMGPGRLDECTIGIENSDATDGLQVVYNASYMHDNLAIGIFTDWLTASPLSGVIDPYTSSDATITFDASMLEEGNYSGNINLETNDPDSPDVDIPCAFIVATTPITDVGISGVINPPDSMVTGSSYPLMAEVRNYGSYSQTFDVVFEVYKSGSPLVEIEDTITIIDMPAGGVDTVEFGETFMPDVDATYDLVAYSLLSGDMNNSNDTSLVVSDSYTWVTFWFGLPDGTALVASPDSRLNIGAFIQTPENAHLGNLHLCLGTDDQYITGLLGVTEGQLYYPLSEWDTAEFLGPEGSPPNPYGWSSQSFNGQAISPNPWLHFETPTLLLEFVVNTVDDTNIIGDTVSCLAAGINSTYGLSSASDTLGIRGYPLTVFFSQVFFVPSQSDYEYLPGDANMYNGAWPPSVIGGDVTYLVNYFRGLEASPACLLGDFWCSADANGDCLVIGSDVTKLVTYFRGLTDIVYCIDYEPAWPTPDDLPAEAPVGWPNCASIPVTAKVIPIGANDD